MIDFFIDHYWMDALVWAALFNSDSSMTHACARLYQAGAREKLAFEGSYEITPYHQRDVDALRRMSPRFLLALVVGFVAVGTLGYLSHDDSPGLFAFMLGALILLQLMVHIRHVRNYVLFRAMATDAVRGRLEYSRPVLLRNSSLEILTFAVMFLVLFVFTRSVFVLGGAFGCAVVAIQHWVLMRRAIRRSPDRPSSD